MTFAFVTLREFLVDSRDGTGLTACRSVLGGRRHLGKAAPPSSKDTESLATGGSDPGFRRGAFHPQHEQHFPLSLEVSCHSLFMMDSSPYIDFKVFSFFEEEKIDADTYLSRIDSDENLSLESNILYFYMDFKIKHPSKL